MNARDTNRSRIEALYRALNAADIDGVMACYGEGARIEVVAPGPFEGEHAPSRDLLERLFQAIPELTFEIRSLLFDGEAGKRRSLHEPLPQPLRAPGRPHREFPRVPHVSGG